jgi:ParB family chromosome partitioning protein
MSTNQNGTAGAVSTPDSARQITSEVIERAQKSPGNAPRQSQVALAIKKQGTGKVDAVLLAPVRIKPNGFAPVQSAATDQQKKFQLLLKDIELQRGNVNPIKVRRIDGDAEADYEIVFGHRRHRACLLLGLPLLAIVEDVSDKELFVQAVRENAHRSQNSPYDRGVMFRRALDASLFKDVQELATDSNLDTSLVYKMVKLADLPSV